MVELNAGPCPNCGATMAGGEIFFVCLPCHYTEPVPGAVIKPIVKIRRISAGGHAGSGTALSSRLASSEEPDHMIEDFKANRFKGNPAGAPPGGGSEH